MIAGRCRSGAGFGDECEPDGQDCPGSAREDGRARRVLGEAGLYFHARGHGRPRVGRMVRREGHLTITLGQKSGHPMTGHATAGSRSGMAC